MTNDPLRELNNKLEYKKKKRKKKEKEKMN